jgi:uncharacterized protein (TIGR02246 family)
MADDDVLAVVRALEERVQELEDRMEILQVIAAYGPAVDAGEAETVSRLWTEDGVYDVDGTWLLEGRDAIAGMVRSDPHQGYIHGGSGHFQQLPRIDIDGDRAVAIHHSQLVLRDGQGYRIERVTANRWDLERTPDGWRATHRRAQVLDGEPAGRDVLAGRWLPETAGSDGTT